MSVPVAADERITSLDLIRGVATLGILLMNSLTFSLSPAAYFNMPSDGLFQPLDWVLGFFVIIFIDQKMMALFSLLFGVGVTVFAERAQAKGRRVNWLSLWRFLLLFAFGMIHFFFWTGDVLMLYSGCAVVVLFARSLPTKYLAVAGFGATLLPSVFAPLAQSTIPDSGIGLGELWFPGDLYVTWWPLLWFLFDGIGRALGLMMIGVACYRWGIVQGNRDDRFYWLMVTIGLGAGTAITAAGVWFRVASDWSSQYAITGRVPTSAGTVPMALGYLGLVLLWHRKSIGRRLPGRERLGNVGRMAFTNYISQTALGLLIMESLDLEWSRTMIAGWVLIVWTLQLWWSTWWLRRFRFGPLEWLWRSATYRRLQPFRLVTPVRTGG